VNGAKFDDGAHCDNSDTEPVGSYAANGYGLYDMAGNVWEWVSDWYAEDYYQHSPGNNPAGPELMAVRVRRGGSWSVSAGSLRTAARTWGYPDVSTINGGIRCAKDVTQ
jgi:formylglycine-generating enzyme